MDDTMDTISDPNNNTPREKSYSLRPRAVMKKDEEDTDQEDSWRPRGRSKRRSKQKCLPLSKYRRKTANARERSRMREINEAFEALRRALPHFNPRTENPNEKTTKITTLRLAMKYITALDSALQQADFDSDGESLLSDYSMTPPTSREHSLTPSSLSEQSDIFDQLFVTSSFEDYSPPATTSNCSISPFLSETLRSSSRSSLHQSSKLDSLNLQPSLIPLRNQTIRLLPPSSFETSLHLTSKSLPTKTPSLPTFNLLSTSAASQPECHPSHVDTVKDPFPTVDIQEYASTSWRDFDGLPSSPMSLDDLFIT